MHVLVLVRRFAMMLFSFNVGWFVQFTIDQQTVGSLIVNDKSLTDITALEIGNVGENIAVRRALYLRAANEMQLVASYVHSTGKFFLILCEMI